LGTLQRPHNPGNPFPYSYVGSKEKWVEIGNCLIGESA
jgi:hypothetical protein